MLTLMDEHPDIKEGREGPRGAQVPVLRGVGWRREGEFVFPRNEDDVMGVRCAA